MFDEILKMVKDQLGGNPQISSALPVGQEEEVHKEIAGHINNGLQSEVQNQGGVGGLLSSLANGGTVTNMIEGGLVGTLGSKFGLSPAITGAISAALPGILQKFAHKANDPNDSSITPDSIKSSFGGLGNLGALGGLFK